MYLYIKQRLWNRQKCALYQQAKQSCLNLSTTWIRPPQRTTILYVRIKYRASPILSLSAKFNGRRRSCAWRITSTDQLSVRASRQYRDWHPVSSWVLPNHDESWEGLYHDRINHNIRVSNRALRSLEHLRRKWGLRVEINSCSLRTRGERDSASHSSPCPPGRSVPAPPTALSHICCSSSSMPWDHNLSMPRRRAIRPIACHIVPDLTQGLYSGLCLW